MQAQGLAVFCKGGSANNEDDSVLGVQRMREVELVERKEVGELELYS